MEKKSRRQQKTRIDISFILTVVLAVTAIFTTLSLVYKDAEEVYLDGIKEDHPELTSDDWNNPYGIKINGDYAQFPSVEACEIFFEDAYDNLEYVYRDNFDTEMEYIQFICEQAHNW